MTVMPERVRVKPDNHLKIINSKRLALVLIWPYFWRDRSAEQAWRALILATVNSHFGMTAGCLRYSFGQAKSLGVLSVAI
jgi:hypothetical protein